MSLLKDKMEGLSVAELKKQVQTIRKEMHRPLKGLKKSDLLEEVKKYSPAPAPAKVEKKVRTPPAVVDVPVAIIGKTPAKKAKVEESDEEPPKKASRKSAPVAVPASLIVEPKASRPAKGSEEMKARMAAMREKKGKKE
jgi:hypothetical protein